MKSKVVVLHCDFCGTTRAVFRTLEIQTGPENYEKFKICVDCVDKLYSNYMEKKNEIRNNITHESCT